MASEVDGADIMGAVDAATALLPNALSRLNEHVGVWLAERIIGAVEVKLASTPPAAVLLICGLNAAAARADDVA